MAYCVECGVELVSGAAKCPLCGREVAAPKELIGEKGEELFPGNPHAPSRSPLRLDKYRKGLTELILTFAAIAELTLIITGTAFGNILIFWRPFLYVLLGTAALLVLLFVRLNYRNIATWYSWLTTATLIIADSTDNLFSWVAYPVTGLILFYTFSVFLLYHRIPLALRLVTALAILLASLAGFDLFTHLQLTWFLPVALPVVGVAIVTLTGTFVRSVKGHPSIPDIILMLLMSASISTVAGDFFALRWKGSQDILSWSFSLFIISLLLLVFISITMSVKKVRYYFQNRVI